MAGIEFDAFKFDPVKLFWNAGDRRGRPGSIL